MSAWPGRSSRWWIDIDRTAHRSTLAEGTVGPLSVSSVADLGQVRWTSNPSLEYLDQEAAAGRQSRWNLSGVDPLRQIGVYVPAREWTSHPALMVADGQVDICVQLGGGLWDHAAIAGVVHAAGGESVAVDQPDKRLAIGAVAFTNAAIANTYRATIHNSR